jgi:hypothetical protein
MQSIGLPKVKSKKGSGTEALRRTWLAPIVAIGLLMLIATGAILAIWEDLAKKSETHKVDAAQLNVRKMQQDAVAIESTPAKSDLRATSTSDDPSSLTTEDLVIEGLLGGPDRLPVTRKRTPRRFGTESDEKDRRFRSHLSVVARKSGYGPDWKSKWPKAFVIYLEAHQNYLRKILRHSETASLNSR